MAPTGTRSYYVEISYRKDRPLNPERVVRRAIDDLCDIGFIRRRRDVLLSDVMDVECAYVIYDQNHSRARQIILTYLEKNNIFSIGRYGSWEYSGMEEAMEQGRRVIGLIKKGR
jgi:UDP-galactopyranose mutase